MKPDKIYTGRSTIRMYNCDCMDMMKTGNWDLAIVDPPYGGGQHFNFRKGVGDEVYRNDRPKPEYFTSVFRVSENQIIWGGNYFTNMLPVNRCWISWYKGQPIDSFSDFELAWTSFDQTSRAIKLESYGFNHADIKETGNGTIHPTQKPVALYKRLLKKYANEGDTILDTHGGSMSIAIACWDLGFDLDICELDTDYFNDAVKRFENHIAQKQMEFQ